MAAYAPWPREGAGANGGSNTNEMIEFCSGKGGDSRRGRGRRTSTLLVLAAGVAALAGCSSAPTTDDPSDPWESTNRAFYDFNDTLDKAITGPIAEQYVKLPDGLRDSVNNFFDNASYPVTALNQFLQGKIERGLEDSFRFVVNTTFGIGGLFDIASGMGLKRHDEDFGQTLAVWGAGSGNFINWPLLGPSNVRDTVGLAADAVTSPLFWIALDAEIFIPMALVRAIDTRSRLISAIKLRDESALDPYVFTREAYRQSRLNKIYDGNPPLEGLEDLDLDEKESIDKEFEKDVDQERDSEKDKEKEN